MQRHHLYLAIALSVTAIGVWAGGPPSFTIPHTFSAGTPANAAEVNANFTALQDQIVYLNQQLVAQQTTINNLQSQLSVVQNSKVMALEGNLNLVDVPDTVDPNITYPTIQFVGANVQIVNDTAITGSANGLGNLILGYNRTSFGDLAFCSDGHYDNEDDCEGNGSTWAKSQRSGSHNLVLGSYNAYSSYGGIVAGYRNILNGGYATVVGGQMSMASGFNSSVTGGSRNIASGAIASVTAGFLNIASGQASSVNGGVGNEASGTDSSVSGGDHISATVDKQWCGGGTSSSPNCN